MIVGLDTSVLIFLLESDPQDPARRKRHAYVHAHYEGWVASDAELWVPAPAVAELAGHISSANMIEVLHQAFPLMEVRHLDAVAAARAGEVHRKTTPARATGDGTRVCVKFDSLIAGWADQAGVDVLATTNARDFTARLEAVGSKVKVVAVDDPPRQVPIVYGG